MSFFFYFNFAVAIVLLGLVDSTVESAPKKKGISIFSSLRSALKNQDKKGENVFIDQRQSGDYNYFINLKNLHFALAYGGSEEYTDYDYNYDYSELTMKPINSSTTTPVSITSAGPYSANETSDSQNEANVDSLNTTDAVTQNVTTVAPPSDDAKISTTEKVVEITPAKPEPDAKVNATDNRIVNDEESKPNELPSPIKNKDATKLVVIEVLPSNQNQSTYGDKINTLKETLNTTDIKHVIVARDCGKGYKKNSRGECEPRYHLNQGNALRKLVELSQRLKARKEN